MRLFLADHLVDKKNSDLKEKGLPLYRVVSNDSHFQ